MASVAVSGLDDCCATVDAKIVREVIVKKATRGTIQRSCLAMFISFSWLCCKVWFRVATPSGLVETRYRALGLPPLRGCQVEGSLILRNTVDRRGPRHATHGILLEKLHRLLYRAFELRIVTLYHLGRSVLDLDVRRDAFVLNRPLTCEIVERKARRGDAAAVNRRWNSERADQPAPRARANQRADLAKPEIIRQRVAARTRRLVDDHHLRTVDAGGRRSRGLSVAQGEVTHQLSIKLVDNVVRYLTSLIVTLVNDRAVLLLLRVIISSEVLVPGAA